MPHGFTLDEDTRASDIIRLDEDVTAPFDEEWLTEAFNLDEDTESPQGVEIDLAFVPAEAQERGKSSPTNVLVPAFQVLHLNIPATDVDRGIVKARERLFSELRKRGRIITTDELVEQ